MLVYKFHERKATQAAARLLKLAGGKLPYIKLIKLLYLADREVFLKSGMPMTGDKWCSMKQGPVLSGVYDLIREDRAQPSAWDELIAPPERYEVGLKIEQPPMDELSDFEIGVLDDVFSKFGKMDKWALCEMTHQICPEWRDAGTSSIPIEPRDILVVEGKSEDEIAAYHEAAEASLFLESLA
jgi:uncharacterized phage-associated protein